MLPPPFVSQTGPPASRLAFVCRVAVVVGALLIGSTPLAAEPPESDSDQPSPPSQQEAEGRARLMHEIIHGALQVMHRDFFDEDESHVIPSHSLEDVFAELARGHQVEVRWLVVNGGAMNVDNKPRDAFEKRAVEALIKGSPQYAETDDGKYRFVGSIRLASQCLKCHLPNRMSTEDRLAGVVISMPVALSEQEK